MSTGGKDKSTKTDPKPKAGGGGIGNIIGIGAVAAFSILAIWGLFGQSEPESTARPIPASQVKPRAPVAPAASTTSSSSVIPSQPPTRTGQPWEYDAATGHHYDPRAGHQHWHRGQPPPEDQRAQLSAQPTLTPVTSQPGAPTVTPITAPTVTPTVTPVTIPAGPNRSGTPWEYDPGTDHHWHPDHGHWHRGQPPPEGQR